MFNYYPKDPNYVLGHYSLYMIISNGYVLRVLGLTLGCVVPNVFATDEFSNFSLGSSLLVHFLNKVINTYIYIWLTPFKPIFSNVPNILLIGYYTQIGYYPLANFLYYAQYLSILDIGCLSISNTHS